MFFHGDIVSFAWFIFWSLQSPKSSEESDEFSEEENIPLKLWLSEVKKSLLCCDIIV